MQPRPLGDTIRRIDRLLQLAASHLVALALLMMVIVVVTLVVGRYVFGIAFFWGEELARYIMIYMAFLGGAVALRTDAHPRLTVFVGMLPRSAQRVIGAIMCILLAVTLVILLYQGLDVALNEGRMRTPALRIRYFWIFLAVPIGAAGMLIQLGFKLFLPAAVSVAEDDDIREVFE
jgi:TRAP-type C4-dicarboxylate transport system permease small subunit